MEDDLKKNKNIKTNHFFLKNQNDDLKNKWKMTSKKIKIEDNLKKIKMKDNLKK